MKNVSLNNDDLLVYFNTVEELKKHPSMDEYREGYIKLRDADAYAYEINNYISAHTELRRLDRKRLSLIDNFIIELNPISSSTARTAAKSSGNLDIMHERMIYHKAISEKSDDEIVALVIKQRKEVAHEFQRSVEKSLEQLTHIGATSDKKCKKMSL